eukprot:3508805-Amphidinium_carterae.1
MVKKGLALEGGSGAPKCSELCRKIVFACRSDLSMNINTIAEAPDHLRWTVHLCGRHNRACEEQGQTSMGGKGGAERAAQAAASHTGE